MRELFSNQVLWTAIAANALAQLIKAVLVLQSEKKWNTERLFGSGGMPSSHAALVTALAAGTAFSQGVGSPLFALSVVFALIVMHDACGVRQAAGKHAHILNQLMADLHQLLDQGFKPQVLKTFLGHSCLQVLAGFLIGLAVALVSFGIWPG